MAGEYLEQFSYEYLLNVALSAVPTSTDKRPGSIIYDALAPACYELAYFFMCLRQFYMDSFALTANGQALELHLAGQGLTPRLLATYAIRKGEFKTANGNAIAIPIGSRFSALTESETINFKVVSTHKDEFGVGVAGTYQLVCETAGTKGNQYIGEILPIDFIQGLSSAVLTDVIISGADTETDEEARARYLETVNSTSFGGNVAQYKELIKNLKTKDGHDIRLGEPQVYPAGKGGGTVVISVVNTQFLTLDSDEIKNIQNIIDPQNAYPDQPEINTQGLGLGLAPIDHKVFITTPTEKYISINANISLMAPLVLDNVKELIVEELDVYFKKLRQEWGNGDTYNRYFLAVYISQINAAMLRVSGISNATNILLDAVSTDIILKENETVQELPLLGEVTINDTVIYTP